MLYGERSRQELNDFAEKLFAKSEIIKDKTSRRNLFDELNNRFNMDISTADDLITFKRDIKEFTAFQIFCVVWFLDRNSLTKFFSEQEIKALSKEKFQKETISFPLEFNMLRVADDQWVGATSLQELMRMKRARLLNYDENEQRALRRVKFGNTEIYKPYVNNRAVKEIKEAMLNGTYIPDIITLNLPDGSEYEYNNGKLTIFSIPSGMFNLDDGYHRYLAMSQINDENREFDYPMELRIVNFDPGKATGFIFQQDQKTKMKKITSDTYNPNDIANKIATRINNDRLGCNIAGMIGRNNSNIDLGVFTKLITYFFIKNKPKKEEEMKFIISIQSELTTKFNLITSQDDTFLGKYDDVMLFTVMYVFSSDNNTENYVTNIRKVIDSIAEEEKRYFNISSSGVVRKKAVSIIENKLGRR